MFVAIYRVHLKQNYNYNILVSYIHKIADMISLLGNITQLTRANLHLAFFELEFAVAVIVSLAVTVRGSVHVAQIFPALEFEIGTEIVAVLEPQLVAVLPVIALDTTATVRCAAIALPAHQIHAITHRVVVRHFVANVQSFHGH